MKNRIWYWPDHDFRVYCERNEDYRKITTRKGSLRRSTYSFPDGSVKYDVIVPRNLHNRVAELLGLPNRVRVHAKRQETSSQVVAAHGGQNSSAISKRRLIDSEGPGKLQNHSAVKESLIKYWVRNREILFVRLGRQIRFDRDDVLEWIKAKGDAPRFVDNRELKRV